MSYAYAYVYVSFFKTTGQQTLSPIVPLALSVTEKKSRPRSFIINSEICFLPTAFFTLSRVQKVKYVFFC
jgi:hypothetical protein